MLLPSIGILLIPFAYALLTKDDLVFVNNKINASNGSLSILGVFSILAVSNLKSATIIQYTIKGRFMNR